MIIITIPSWPKYCLNNYLKILLKQKVNLEKYTAAKSLLKWNSLEHLIIWAVVNQRLQRWAKHILTSRFVNDFIFFYFDKL